MSRIPTKEENPNGFHQRYVVEKIVGWKQIPNKRVHPDGTTEVVGHIDEAITKPIDEGAEYVVFRVDEGGKDREHIKAGRIAVNAYADAIQHHLPEVAKDLRERYPLL